MDRAPAAYEPACAPVALASEPRRTGRPREAGGPRTAASTWRSGAAPTRSPSDTLTGRERAPTRPAAENRTGPGAGEVPRTGGDPVAGYREPATGHRSLRA